MQAELIVKSIEMPGGCGVAVDTAHWQPLGSMSKTLFLAQHPNVYIADAYSVGYFMLI